MMTANEAFAAGLEMGRQWLLGLVKDLKDEELVAQPTAAGGNHALWVLGHLAVSEAAVVNGYVLGGQANPLKSWESVYGLGSTPTTSAADYASIETLIAKLEEVRQATLEVIQEMPAEEFDEKTSADNELFATKGRCFAMLISHQAFHAGQIADVRKALGRKPAFA